MVVTKFLLSLLVCCIKLLLPFCVLPPNIMLNALMGIILTISLYNKKIGINIILWEISSAILFTIWNNTRLILLLITCGIYWLIPMT